MAKHPHAEGVEAGSTLGTITGIAITTGASNKDAAWDFVSFVSGTEGAQIMAQTGNFPAIMTDEAMNLIAGLEGFPTDEQSKEALKVSNLYLEVPYHESVSEVNSILDTYHASIMSGEMSIDDGNCCYERGDWKDSKVRAGKRYNIVEIHSGLADNQPDLIRRKGGDFLWIRRKEGRN